MPSTCIISTNGEKKSTIFVNSANELVFGEKVLCKNMSKNFDAIAEENGAHIVAASLAGELLYIKIFGENAEIGKILESKSGKNMENIRTILINGRIYAFYCIESGGKTLLIEHILDNEPKDPFVAEYLGKRRVYDICADREQNIHIFFADENSNLKHRAFLNSSKSLSEAKTLAEGDVLGIGCAWPYAAYLAREGEYKVINIISATGAEKHAVVFGVDALSEPAIFAEKGDIVVQWCEKGYAFERIGNENMEFEKTRSVGLCRELVRVRSPFDQSTEKIEKCAASRANKLLGRAEAAFCSACKPLKTEFLPKGSDVYAFSKENARAFDDKKDEIYELEKRIDELEIRFNILSAEFCKGNSQIEKAEHIVNEEE